jgi:hypothetical protein
MATACALRRASRLVERAELDLPCGAGIRCPVRHQTSRAAASARACDSTLAHGMTVHRRSTPRGRDRRTPGVAWSREPYRRPWLRASSTHPTKSAESTAMTFRRNAPGERRAVVAVEAKRVLELLRHVGPDDHAEDHGADCPALRRSPPVSGGTEPRPRSSSSSRAASSTVSARAHRWLADAESAAGSGTQRRRARAAEPGAGAAAAKAVWRRTRPQPPLASG